MNHIFEIVSKRKTAAVGIYSACTANEYTITAALEAGILHKTPVLIEATANQCNQFGGYTGMMPADFMGYVNRLAETVGLPKDLLILGGDHLGPLTWQNEPVESAMRKARELVASYVKAGFTKIHLDTSMHLLDDDKTKPLSDADIAARAASLAKVCEDSYRELAATNSGAVAPVYVIGSEVPIPGGAQEHESKVSITTPDQFSDTYETFKSAFLDNGLSDAFDRVVGVVVQPGVEFGDDDVLYYNRESAARLTARLLKYDGIVFEGHSTDYQTREHLKQMVEDGIAILKVGPAMTFYFREAVFALADIETELAAQRSVKLSNFKSVLECEMLANPANWTKHYSGTDAELYFKRRFSLSDRARYYFPVPAVGDALCRLIANIGLMNPPGSLISQYLPSAYARLRNEDTPITAENLIKARITDCIDDYLYATDICKYS